MTARVVPPLTGASPTITAAMLTATSLPETAPALWSGATTYALNDQRSIAGANNSFDVYISLLGTNLNHSPAVSPTWWRKLGTTYGVFVLGSYALNDRVIDPTTHLEYLSLVGTNTADITDDTKWQLQGYDNRWRAFDVLRSTGATGPSGTYFTITPGQRVDAIGFAGIVADSFTISLKVASVEVWTHTESLSSRDTLTWSDYFLGDFTYLSVSAVFDIPKYSGAVITVTFNRAAGDVTIGSVWIGNAVYIGELETEPNLGRRNFSTIDNTESGETVLVQKRTIPEQSWLLWLPKPHLRKVIPLLDLLNAVPGLWAGLDDTADEYFGPLLLVAVFTRFDITPGHPDVRIDLQLRET